MKLSICHNQFSSKIVCLIIVLLTGFGLNAVDSDDDQEINIKPSCSTSPIPKHPDAPKPERRLPRSSSDSKPKNSNNSDSFSIFKPSLSILSSSENTPTGPENKRNPAKLFRSKSDWTPPNDNDQLSFTTTSNDTPVLSISFNPSKIPHPRHSRTPSPSEIKKPLSPLTIMPHRNLETEDATEILGWDMIQTICRYTDDLKTVSSFMLCNKKCYYNLKNLRNIMTATNQILKLQKLGFMKHFAPSKDRHMIMEKVETLINEPDMHPDILMEDSKFIVKQLYKGAVNIHEDTIRIKVEDDLVTTLDYQHKICEFFLKIDVILKQYEKMKGQKSSLYKQNFLKVMFLISENDEKKCRQFSLFPDFVSHNISLMYEKSNEGYKSLKFSYNPLNDNIKSCFWGKPDNDPFWDFLSQYADFCQKSFLEYANEETSDFSEE